MTKHSPQIAIHCCPATCGTMKGGSPLASAECIAWFPCFHSRMSLRPQVCSCLGPQDMQRWEGRIQCRRVSQESQRRGALSLEEGVGCQALRHSLDRTNQTHPVDFWDTILPQLPERKHELEKARKRSGALKLEPTCFSVSGRGSVWQSQYQNESVAEPIAILLESSFPIGIHCHLLRFGTTGALQAYINSLQSPYLRFGTTGSL